MTKRNTGHSPNFINANKIKLPDCEATADTIVQMLVEGYSDGFSRRHRREQPVVDGKEAA